MPLQASGARRDCVFAFARAEGDAVAITCVPRLIASVVPDPTTLPLGAVWLDTRIDLPATASPGYSRPFRDVFTNAVVEPVTVNGALAMPAAALFDRFPVALLVPCST